MRQKHCLENGFMMYSHIIKNSVNFEHTKKLWAAALTHFLLKPWPLLVLSDIDNFEIITDTNIGSAAHP